MHARDPMLFVDWTDTKDPDCLSLPHPTPLVAAKSDHHRDAPPRSCRRLH